MHKVQKSPPKQLFMSFSHFDLQRGPGHQTKLVFYSQKSLVYKHNLKGNAKLICLQWILKCHKGFVVLLSMAITEKIK